MSGFAVAGALLGWAAICFVAPLLLDAHGGVRIPWYIIGFLLGLIGVAGGMTELAKLTQAEFWSDFWVALVLFALAIGAFLAAETWQPPSPLSGILKAVGLVFGALGFLGLGSGASKAARARRARGPAATDISRPRSLTAGVLVAIGLLTAALNLFAAFRSTV